jgi:hypothetical protein
VWLLLQLEGIVVLSYWHHCTYKSSYMGPLYQPHIPLQPNVAPTIIVGTHGCYNLRAPLHTACNSRIRPLACGLKCGHLQQHSSQRFPTSYLCVVHSNNCQQWCVPSNLSHMVQVQVRVRQRLGSNFPIRFG